MKQAKSRIEKLIDQFSENEFIQSIKLAEMSGGLIVYSAGHLKISQESCDGYIKLINATSAISDTKIVNTLYTEHTDNYSYIKMLDEDAFIVTEFDPSTKHLGKVKAFCAGIQLMFNEDKQILIN